jgi:hypothetical protein
MKSDEILIKTFDQVKNDNFDQVNFDQVIVCLLLMLIGCLNKSQFEMINKVNIINVNLFLTLERRTRHARRTLPGLRAA